MARRRNRGRNVNGVLLLDKPTGLTSNAALQRVKRLFNANKAGHTGSLDPLASGMLPICLGEATKISGFLLSADKEYHVICKLGVTTDSGDADGELRATRPLGDISAERLQTVLEGFLGQSQQIPPMHSAIKRNGQPLYKLAREGVEVERAPREITIHSLEMRRFEGDELELVVSCTKGTYIRVLAEDIGEALGCGAHVSALRRTGVGTLDQQPMYTLEGLQNLAEEGGFDALDAVLLPMESTLADWPEVRLSEDASFYLCQGQAVFVPQLKESGWVRLYSGNDRFLGLGTVLDDGRVAPKRLLSTQ